MRNLLPFDGAAVLHARFLAPGDADGLLAGLRGALDWRQESVTRAGRAIPVPRLTAWCGDRPYAYSGIAHAPAPWPADLLGLLDLVRGHAPGVNSVLGNLYRDGRDHVSWHADDEPELGEDPVIASVSLGAARRFALRHTGTGRTVALDLPHGSLLVMAGACQRCWRHAVPPTARAVGPRINLTFRTIIDP